MSDDERTTTMNIIEKHVYQSATLPGAPERATRAEAEADEARGIELAAYLALLPTLTAEQWDAAGDAARVAGGGCGAVCGVVCGAGCGVGYGAGYGVGCGAGCRVGCDVGCGAVCGVVCGVGR